MGGKEERPISILEGLEGRVEEVLKRSEVYERYGNYIPVIAEGIQILNLGGSRERLRLFLKREVPEEASDLRQELFSLATNLQSGFKGIHGVRIPPRNSKS